MFFRTIPKTPNSEEVKEVWARLEADFSDMEAIRPTDTQGETIFATPCCSDIPNRGSLEAINPIQAVWVMILSLYGGFELVDKDLAFQDMAYERQLEEVARVTGHYHNPRLIAFLHEVLKKWGGRFDFDFY